MDVLLERGRASPSPAHHSAVMAEGDGGRRSTRSGDGVTYSRKCNMARNSSPLLLLLLLSCCLLHWARTCYVTNCPPGGKRSLFNRHLSATKRQCSSCGPGGKGRCYGPSICCGSEMGCRVLAPKESATCEIEASYPGPCDNAGEACGDEGNGRCALKGLCCSTDGCWAEEACAGADSAPPKPPPLLR